MSSSTTHLPLHQKSPVKKPIKRSVELLIFILALCLLLNRLIHLKSHGLPWLLAFFCELCFTFDWFLYILLNWSPVDCKTYPQRLLQQVLEVPPVDVLVTTADWKLEPPIMVVNTVLSVLAVDYPAGKLACYVSDDGGSSILLYSLVEASNFANIWVPFCKKYNVQVRAPFRYFSGESPSVGGHEFRREEKRMKDEYEKLCERIEIAAEKPMVYESSEYYEAFRNTNNKNHPTIIKVLLENKGDDSNGIPNLVYVAREKRPNQPHYYKAGALNALIRVSGVMTNAPFIVNLDCDMFINNPNVVVEAMCVLLGAKEEESVFVQFPQMFYNQSKDDPFGCQLNTLFQVVLRGMAGIQGPLFGGCNCFLRRKTIYTLNSSQNQQEKLENFGESEELTKSANEIITGSQSNGHNQTVNLSSSIQAAYQLASCNYENNTAWGLKVGFLYGTIMEDILTGMKIHSQGWKSVLLLPSSPAFLGLAPTGGPDALVQRKRWVSGSLELLFSKNSPLLATFSTQLKLRQGLAYTYFLIRSLCAIPQLAYAILPAYAILTNSHFLPSSVQDRALLGMFLPIFILYHSHSICVYLQSGLSLRAWVNGKKMEMISATSSYIFGILSLVLKLFGISEIVFEVTPKSQSDPDIDVDHRDIGRFAFNESPLFVLGTMIVLLHLMALTLALVGMQPSPSEGRRGFGIGEILGSVGVLLCLLPFLRGLFAKGKYGIPSPTIAKSAALALLFVPFSKWL